MNFKSIYYFLCIFFILSCNEKKQKEIEETEFEITLEVTVDNLSEYPKVIDSLGLHDLYDSTKWQLYLLQALDTPKYDDKYDQGEYIFDSTVSYAKLELRFDSLYVDDTGCIKLYFEFYVNDIQSLNPNDFRGMKGYVNGIEYDLNYGSDSTIYICHLDKFRIYGIGRMCHIYPRKLADTTTNVIYNPLQPDVIEYLNKHKNEIHPWLYKEGVKRGVIKE